MVSRRDTAEPGTALASAENVAVIGDTHGSVQWHRTLVDRLCGDRGVRVLLHVGDLGIGP